MHKVKKCFFISDILDMTVSTTEFFNLKSSIMLLLTCFQQTGGRLWFSEILKYSELIKKQGKPPTVS